MIKQTLVRSSVLCALVILFVGVSSPVFGQTDRHRSALASIEHDKPIVYKTVGGKELDLIHFKPQNRSEGKTSPWMLFVHGGGWRGGDKYNILNSAFVGTLKKLTDSGIACFTIEYRLTRNHSTAFESVVDCKDACRFLLKNASTYHLDTERYGVWGGSAGGHLSLMTALGKNADFEGDPALAAFTPKFKCVAAYYPLTSLVNPEVLKGSKFEDPSALLHVLDGPFAAKPKLARLLSPVEYLSPKSPPILLLHGNNDSTLSVKNSLYMKEVAIEKGADVELLIVKNAGHSFKGKGIVPSIDEINEASAEYIGSRLNPQTQTKEH